MLVVNVCASFGELPAPFADVLNADASFATSPNCLQISIGESFFAFKIRTRSRMAIRLALSFPVIFQVVGMEWKGLSGVAGFLLVPRATSVQRWKPYFYMHLVYSYIFLFQKINPENKKQFVFCGCLITTVILITN